jgi:hypothetical protein
MNGLTMTHSSVAWKLLKRNVVKPEEKTMTQLLEDYRKGSRAYVLNPKYASPTSLPLYFYFGYQFLQESKLLKKSGHVSKLKLMSLPTIFLTSFVIDIVHY